MNETENLTEARRWIRYAREDLAAAQAMLNTPSFVPRQACWLAQQSTEKALKAVLVYLQTDFPRRHDLDLLRNLIPPDWQVRQQFPDLAALTEWAVEARYPGDWVDAGRSDAELAVQQARQVFDTVELDFRRRGLELG